MFKTNFGKVVDFHRAFNHPVSRDTSVLVGAELIKLRIALIEEELSELKQALANQDSIETADALADILYVTYGAAAAFGIPINSIFQEVHESNMSKLNTDGRPLVRADGKILKGPNYRPPNIYQILELHKRVASTLTETVQYLR